MLFGCRCEFVIAIAVPREESHPCKRRKHEHLDEDVDDEGLKYVFLR